MLRHVHQLCGPRRLSLLGLQGAAADGERPLRALYAGSGTNLEFLCCLFSLDGARQERGTANAPLALAAALAQATGDADLVLTDLPPLWSAAVRTRADVAVPAWVRQEIVLGCDEGDSPVPRPARREAERHARRSGFTVDFTSSAELLDRFHDELYRPYVLARFGAQAIVVGHDTFRARTEGRMLARLHAAGRWLAGLLLTVEKDTLRFGWFGACSAPPPRGASEVLDYACLREAQRLGLKRVVLGNTRPCLNDGVLRYKERLGARLTSTRFPQDTITISVRSGAYAA